ncbi:MAG: polynucleotide adenylyltransferase, partial [Spirochaetaceae bacterium]|nr:polynucleotide adenylyltransferase [Spirochaetaceae bacterium]
FTARIETVLRESRALSLKDLAINGHDITALGITDGKRIGAILRSLLDAVLSNPALNTRETLLAMAEKAETEMA